MPPLYLFFEDLFHLALDVAFFTITCRMLVFVMRTKQRQHNKWLAPSIVSCFIALFYRLVIIGHHFLGTAWSPQHYMVVDILPDFEDVASLVSTVFLWLVLKSSGFSQPAATFPSQEGAGSGAWPPAPRS
jgi:hypothetical protein